MLIKYPEEVNNVPFDIANIENCEMAVLGLTSQVQIDNVNNSKLFIGPVDGTAFVRNCKDVNLTIACRQLRTLGCENCTLNLYAATDPIIERSTGMKIKPFNGAYQGLLGHFKAAKLDPNDNHKDNVFDFNKDGKNGYDIPEPHYEIINTKDQDWTFKMPADSKIDYLDMEKNPVP